MSDLPLRIGIIGAGANTKQRHIVGFRALENVEISVVANRSRQSSQRVADEFGIPRVLEHWTQVATDPEVDAVLIGTWPYLHCPATLAALEAGKHVLCEARMASNGDEARRMRDAARARPELIAQVVPSPLTLRVDATVRRLLAEGYLGELLAVDLRAGRDFIDREAPLHWRQEARFSGRNILSLGIWYEALMRWIGAAREVTATGRTMVPMRRDSEGLLQATSIPDHIDVLAEMACGASAHLQISAVTGLAPWQGITLFGSEATLQFSDGQLRGGRRGDSELQPIEIAASEAGAWRVEAEFVAAIGGQETIKLTTFDDGVRYMAFTDAVDESLATGRRVAVPQ